MQTQSLLALALVAFVAGSSTVAAAEDEATKSNAAGVEAVSKHQYLNATKFFRQAYEFRRAQLGAEDASTLQSLSNLALATYRLGDEKKAEQLYNECITIKRKVMPNSASLATTLTNLANLLSDERRCNDASKAYSEALQIDQTVYGPKHIEVANDLFNLGALRYRCNEFEPAQKDFQSAHDLYKELKDDYGIVKSLHYLALCQSALKQHGAAAKTAMEALQFHERLKGKGHADTLVHILNAADEVDATGDTTQAEQLYKQALEAAQRNAKAGNYELAECNLELAQFYDRHTLPENADLYYKAATTHYDSLSKRDKRKLFELPISYSKFLTAQKRTDESLAISHKYLHVFKPGNL